MLTNTAGILPKIFRTPPDNGEWRVVVMIVVQNVARCKFTIRTRIIVLGTTLIMTNTAGTVAVVLRTLSDNGHWSLVQPIMIIVVHSVPMFKCLILEYVPEFKQFCLHSYNDDDDDDDNDDDDDDTDQK